MTFLQALRSCHHRAIRNPRYTNLTKTNIRHKKSTEGCMSLLISRQLSYNQHETHEKNDIFDGTYPHLRNDTPWPVMRCFPSNISFTQIEQIKATSRNQSIRPITSVADLVPEMVKNISIWGGSGIIIKAFHYNGLIPYWACMSLTNITVRTSLLPLVVSGARTSSRFAKVAPEVQFLVTIFQNDLRKLKEQKALPSEQFALMRITFQSLRGLYKLHDVNPLHVFRSPLLQIPIFWYFSIDVRKLINGGDPALAQELTDSGFLWVSDLTDPDPFYGFPIISGMLLYLNVEMAIGQKSLSGAAASKSNLARILKDVFQSVAVFMPCFMSHSPAGVQIYLMTSFVFTLFQGMALRNDPIRDSIGLPAMGAPLPESKFAKEFIELKELEKQAADVRGNGPVLGIGVLAAGFQTSFAGTNRPSTILYDAPKGNGLKEIQFESFASVENNSDESFIPSCIRAPALSPNFDSEPLLGEEREEELIETVAHIISQTTDDSMEAANEGQRPKPPIQILKIEKNQEGVPLNLKGLKSRKKTSIKKSRARKTRRKT